MIVRLGMAPRRAGMTPEQFQQHWRTSHADVVSTMPGLRRYVQLHAVLDGGEPLLPYPGFDACSALSFDDVPGMDAAFESETFRGAVMRDEQDFVDKTRFVGVIADWTSSVPTIDALGSVVTASLWRPDGDVDDLVTTLSRRLTGLPHGFLLADHHAHSTRFPAAADVVELIGHDSVAEAVAFAAHVVPGATLVGRHLARPVVVVGEASPASGPDTDLLDERTT